MAYLLSLSCYRSFLHPIHRHFLFHGLGHHAAVNIDGTRNSLDIDSNFLGGEAGWRKSRWEDISWTVYVLDKCHLCAVELAFERKKCH